MRKAVMMMTSESKVLQSCIVLIIFTPQHERVREIERKSERESEIERESD